MHRDLTNISTVRVTQYPQIYCQKKEPQKSGSEELTGRRQNKQKGSAQMNPENLDEVINVV